MRSRTPISKAQSYQEIGAFWDEHDSTDHGEQTEVEFEVHIRSQRRYYPIDSHLSHKIRDEAERRGISQETLLNLWVQEKIGQSEDKDVA